MPVKIWLPWKHKYKVKLESLAAFALIVKNVVNV